MSQYVLGKKGVLENIKKNNISVVYVKHNFPELLELKNKFNFNIVYQKDNSFYNKFDANHQFIVGLLKTNNLYDDYNSFISDIENSEGNKTIVILDEIQDPGNFGSIIRTCDAFGIAGIIYKKDNQVQINETVVKTSAGAIANVRLLKVSNLSNVISKLKNNEYWIISSCLQDDSVSLEKTKLDFNKLCLIVGNENNGISKNIINASDIKVKIPMYGISQSLNVSVSLGILLYAIKNHK